MLEFNSGPFERNASAAGKRQIERIPGETGGIVIMERGGWRLYSNSHRYQQALHLNVSRERYTT
jgi:hypothetical protein